MYDIFYDTFVCGIDPLFSKSSVSRFTNKLKHGDKIYVFRIPDLKLPDVCIISFENGIAEVFPYKDVSVTLEFYMSLNWLFRENTNFKEKLAECFNIDSAHNFKDFKVLFSPDKFVNINAINTDEEFLKLDKQFNPEKYRKKTPKELKKIERQKRVYEKIKEISKEIEIEFVSDETKQHLENSTRFPSVEFREIYPNILLFMKYMQYLITNKSADIKKITLSVAESCNLDWLDLFLLRDLINKCWAYKISV